MKKTLISGVFLLLICSFGFAKEFSLDDIKTHNGSGSCWTIINNKVYDLTSFVDKHPGGSGAILKLCGTDGTKIFLSQHGKSKKVLSSLNNFLLGDLSKKEDKKMCTMDYNPVCGVDGKTYSNSCVASTQNIKIQYSGECKVALTGTIVSSGSLTILQKKSVDKFLSGLYLQLDKKYEYGTDKINFLTNILNNVDKTLNKLENSKSGNKNYLINVLNYIKSSLNEKIQTLDLRI